MKFVCRVVALVIGCAAITIHADPAPTLVRLQGQLLTTTGDPRSGSVVLVISLYSGETDLTALWSEQQTTTLDASGRYTVYAGATLTDGIPQELFSGAAPGRWLGVAVQGEAEQPRRTLITTPYAVKARDADSVGGKTVNDFVLATALSDSVAAALSTTGISSSGSTGITLNPGSTGEDINLLTGLGSIRQTVSEQNDASRTLWKLDLSATSSGDFESVYSTPRFPDSTRPDRTWTLGYNTLGHAANEPGFGWSIESFYALGTQRFLESYWQYNKVGGGTIRPIMTQVDRLANTSANSYQANIHNFLDGNNRGQFYVGSAGIVTENGLPFVQGMNNASALRGMNAAGNAALNIAKVNSSDIVELGDERGIRIANQFRLNTGLNGLLKASSGDVTASYSVTANGIASETNIDLALSGTGSGAVTLTSSANGGATAWLQGNGTRGPGLRFQKSGSFTGYIGADGQYLGGSTANFMVGANSNLDFYSNFAPTPAMRIDTLGRVNLAGGLGVDGTAAPNHGIRLAAAAPSSVVNALYSPDGHELYFDGGQLAKKSYNVTLNTIAAENNVDLALTGTGTGSINLTNGSNAGATLFLNGNGTRGPGIRFQKSGFYTGYIGSDAQYLGGSTTNFMIGANSNLDFYSNFAAAPSMRIDTAGRINLSGGLGLNGVIAPTHGIRFAAIAPSFVSNVLYSPDGHELYFDGGQLAKKSVNVTLDNIASENNVDLMLTATGTGSFNLASSANGGATAWILGNGTRGPGLRFQKSGAYTGYIGADGQYLGGATTNFMIGANSNLDFYSNFAASAAARITTAGDFGIGTTSPRGKLEVNGTSLLIGDVGIGTASPTQKLDVSGNTAISGNATIGGNAAITGAVTITGTATVAGNVGIGTASPTQRLDVAGNIHASGHVIADGQDVAEWVESAGALEAGTLVIADPTHANRVAMATQAYDTRVIGAVSRDPGVVLGVPGDSKVIVAQSGRVRIKVDATYGAINIGDLLVTSPTAGFAMRSEPLNVGGAAFHRPGTLVGKALEALPAGKGEILALLTLQ